jgi:hypothetical protein
LRFLSFLAESQTYFLTNTLHFSHPKNSFRLTFAYTGKVGWKQYHIKSSLSLQKSAQDISILHNWILHQPVEAVSCVEIIHSVIIKHFVLIINSFCIITSMYRVSYTKGKKIYYKFKLYHIIHGGKIKYLHNEISILNNTSLLWFMWSY